jgi:membrane associated rhomboid family serine protease
MPETEEADEEEWVDVARFPSLDEAQENALVALAMGEAIRVDHGEVPGEFELRVEPAAAPRVSEELREYAAEAEVKPPPPLVSTSWSHHPAGMLHYIVWAAVLLLVFRQQSQVPSLADRYASSSVGLITDGEWWRPFTALFLHGDGGHIIGNLASGAVFGALVSKSIGPWKGWAMILLSGTVGNAITSAVTYPEPFRSLGASTAVFGALGILSGIGLVENFREELRMPWMRVIAPLLAGLILLGWLGGAAPGAGVDVFGHVFGFSAGVLLGAACRYFDSGNAPARILRP